MTATAPHAVVIVASTSAAEGSVADTTGPVIASWLQLRGYDVPAPIIVPDGEPVGDALRGALATSPGVILTTGGTGLSPTDRTPEETAPLIDTEVPGLIEELRRRGAQTVPTAILSRGLAGFAGNTFIMNFPGSPAAVRDGLSTLEDVLEHLLAQRHGDPMGQHEAGR